MPSLASKRSKRLYMRGIGKDITEDDLFEYLSRHGKISEVKMLSHYTFVQFENEEDASLVLQTYQTQPLLGTRVTIEFAHPLRKDMLSISSSGSSPRSHPYSPYSRSTNVRHPVIILNLPRDIRWQELKDFGRSSGMLVAYCDLDKTEEGRGFIEFFTREDAQRAVRVLNGKKLEGRRIRVIDHEDVRDMWNRGRTDRRPRSPVWAPSDYLQGDDDRNLKRGVSARQVYSPVPRMPDMDSGYNHPQYRYLDGHTHHIPGIAYGTEGAYKRPYDVSALAPAEYEPVSYWPEYDYEQIRLHQNMGAYDDGAAEYDTRPFQFQRLMDPYQ